MARQGLETNHCSELSLLQVSGQLEVITGRLEEQHKLAMFHYYIGGTLSVSPISEGK
jgi:hypothetical protein